MSSELYEFHFWNNNSVYERDTDVNNGNGKSLACKIPRRSAVTFVKSDVL